MIYSFRHHRNAHFSPTPTDPNLRIVFQYQGLLEVDPNSGAYKKVLPDRLIDPGKLVTWTPNLVSTEKSLKKTTNNFINRFDTTKRQKQSSGTKLVTWKPSIVENINVDDSNTAVEDLKIIQKSDKGVKANKIYDIFEKQSDNGGEEIVTPAFTQIANNEIDNVARKVLHFEMVDENKESLKPKHVFYSKYKSDSPKDLIWNGKYFDPIPLDDVVPTSAYSNLITKHGLYSKHTSAVTESVEISTQSTTEELIYPTTSKSKKLKQKTSLVDFIASTITKLATKTTTTSSTTAKTTISTTGTSSTTSSTTYSTIRTTTSSTTRLTSSSTTRATSSSTTRATSSSTARSTSTSTISSISDHVKFTSNKKLYSSNLSNDFSINSMLKNHQHSKADDRPTSTFIKDSNELSLLENLPPVFAVYPTDYQETQGANTSFNDQNTIESFDEEGGKLDTDVSFHSVFTNKLKENLNKSSHEPSKTINESLNVTANEINDSVDENFLKWLNDGKTQPSVKPLDELIQQNKDIIKVFPQVHGLSPSTVQPSLSIFDWLASKSKLKQQQQTAVSSTTSTERAETSSEGFFSNLSPKVHSIDGDVLKYWTDYNDVNVDQIDVDDITDETNEIIYSKEAEEEMDLAQSSLQVR